MQAEHRTPNRDTNCWIAKEQLQALIDVLQSDDFTVVGPTVDQNAIVYSEIDSVDQLPIGWSETQGPGSYRLQASGGEQFFEFNVGPHSWKRYLFPARTTLGTAEHSSEGWSFETPEPDPGKLALLGVRACELAAIAVQDRVFMGGPYVDPNYRARRESALIIAVNCTVAASTCFCTSMDTGPRCNAGFDLALTEIDDGFVVEIGSQAGSKIIERLEHQPAKPASIEAAATARQRAVDQIEKQMDTTAIRELLFGNLEHPRWDQVAERCLSCTNCTMVCPTCFCSNVTEVSELGSTRVERVQQWASCFDLDFSYTAGGTFRADTRSRYRQWLTHKLASWHDQFDSSGCVGCGRCITWCPVGIDITEEVAAIRQQPITPRSLPVSKQAPTACPVPKSES